MSTQSQDPQAQALQQPSGKEEVAKSVAPPGPAPTPRGGGTGPRRHPNLKAWLIVAAVVLLGAGGGYAWWKLTRSDLPEGFAQTNGRLEATKVYITTKAPLRVEAILAKEGDSVDAGKVVARMDTRTLKAQLRQAEANIQRAKDAKATAEAQKREREADLVLAKSQLERTQKLIEKGGASQQQLDVDTARWKTAGSALDAAKSKVVESQSAIDAAIADADKLRVDVEDGVLVAPRRGRIHDQPDARRGDAHTGHRSTLPASPPLLSVAGKHSRTESAVPGRSQSCSPLGCAAATLQKGERLLRSPPGRRLQFMDEVPVCCYSREGVNIGNADVSRDALGG
jgi:hypothetical protein